MKYTRSAAQKSQQQQNNNNNNTKTSKSSNKTSNKKLNKKSSSKKQSSKYYSDSDDDNDNNNYYDYDYDDEIDVGEEYYEEEDNYDNQVNTSKKKSSRKTTTTTTLATNYIDDDDYNAIDEDDIEIDDDDDYTQDTNLKSTTSDNDYYSIFDENTRDSLPELRLPQSSDDLLIPKENILDCSSVYETLRHFRNILRLSPFLFEDFCACLATNENNSLFSEIHISLIKSLLKEDEISLVSYGPTDLKTCIDVSFHLMDAFTWPEVLRQFIESDSKMLSLNLSVLNILTKPAYPLVNINDKLVILSSLCNMFLSTAAVRNDLLSEGNIVSDDHCRICHKLGNLLCCETCPATFHLDCLDPPLTNVPKEDWICAICRLHQVIII
jgi:nucleosome-remodeling factor subunit BPTF